MLDTPVALRWLAGGMRNVLFHLQNKEMVQREEEFELGRFQELRYACLS